LEYPGDASWDDQIRDVSMGRPHLLILGAGASRAAFPNGDANGRALPLMADLVDLLDLRELLAVAGLADDPHLDFEAIYDDICRDQALGAIRAELEGRVRAYFETLTLPDEPTLYDAILLALRPKDVVATFNWDPFIWDAWIRNYFRAPMPKLLFLHGNVRVGFCAAHRIKSTAGSPCRVCRTPLRPSQLLYPVRDKRYDSDAFLAGEWEAVAHALRSAYLLTVFGYSAPRTDAAAIGLFQQAWGSPKERSLEEVEFIDIASNDILLDRWDSFIHSHHYTINTSLYDSLIAKHPRRSCEAAWMGLVEARFVDEASYPEPRAGFAAYERFLIPLLEAEGWLPPPQP
jgi:hypothetical protein